MFGAERVGSAGEVRLVPMSAEQRDALAADYLPPESRALVAAWDAAVPGVVDARWAEVRDLLDKVYGGLGDGKAALLAAQQIARAASGGEAAAARECGVVSNDDGVDYRCTLSAGHEGMHSGVAVAALRLRAAGGERPSVSLREGETVDAAFVRIAYETWEALHDGDPNRPVDPYSRAVGELCEIPVEREAEEGERGMRDPSGFGMCIACDMPVERVGWDDLCLACQEDDDDNTEFEEDKDSDA